MLTHSHSSSAHAALAARLHLIGTMLRLPEARRAVLAQALRELAALIFGAFALGWYIGQAPGSAAMPLAGIAAWAVLVGLAMAVTNGKS